MEGEFTVHLPPTTSKSISALKFTDAVRDAETRLMDVRAYRGLPLQLMLPVPPRFEYSHRVRTGQARRSKTWLNEATRECGDERTQARGVSQIHLVPVYRPRLRVLPMPPKCSSLITP